jgi:hypothetical protein
MPEYTGSALLLSWITTSGTLALGSDYRTVNWNPTVAYADITAGSDTHVGRLITLKDATAAVTLVDSVGGTAYITPLAPGVGGTLIIQPLGTTVGKPKITFPCFSDGATPTYTYNDTTTISVNFTGNGVFTESVN